MVDRSLCMPEVRESMPASPIFQRSPAIKEGNTGSCFVRPKEDMDLNIHYAKGGIWNSKELAEKGIGVPNHQGLPQKYVRGNITILMRESKTSVWQKQLLWTPPARHVNRKGKRLACEKHMHWWPASTKPILERYAKDDRPTIELTEERFDMALAPHFNGDVAQMAERSLSMREVRGSMPRISSFSEEPKK